MGAPAVSSLFQITPRYLRSTNLERDIRDTKALEQYVLTPHAHDCLYRLAKGLRPTSTQRAWRLTGNYGSGKSSFALFLARWFSGQGAALSRALNVDVRYEHFSIGYRPNYLTLVVTGSREPMGKAILRSLGLLMDDQYRRGARSSIAQRIDALVNQKHINDADVVDLIRLSNEKLTKDSKCSGLLILVDELGKFLEYAAFHPESQDVFLLQRLAESAAKSGKSAPLFVIGILHQGFDAYAENLDPTVQREWEKIAGRFEEILFHQPLTQVAELIACALRVRTGEVPAFAREEARFGLDAAIQLGMFGRNVPKPKVDSLATRLYPLHGTTLAPLVRAFSRFGQNERSLFGFLLSNEPFSLLNFSNRPVEYGATYRLPNFYDYIRANFGYRLSTQSYRSHWTQIESMVESFATSDAVELAIVKTVGVLNLLDHPDLVATEDMLVACLSGPSGLPKKELLSKIERLHKKRRVLFRRGISGAFYLWPHTSVDLEAAYENATRAVGIVRSVSGTIEEFLEVRPLVARRHYIETGNLRFFDVQYAAVGDIDLVLQRPMVADGRIIVALCETKGECDEAEEIARSPAFQSRRDVLLAVPIEPLSNQAGLVAEAMRWDWVVRNTPELEADRYAREEVSKQRQHARERLSNRIQDLIGLRSLNGARALRWTCAGTHQKIGSGRQLLERLSSLCDELFPRAPKVKNELLNRHSLSKAAAAARMRLIEGLLSRADEPYLGMDTNKKPPEMSMYLSLMRRGRLHVEKDGCWQLAIPSANKDPLRLAPCLNGMRAHVEARPDRRIRVAELLAYISRPPFGVRDGLGLVLLAAYAAMHVQELAFYEDGTFLRELRGDEFLRLTKMPQSFELQLCRITGLRQDVFAALLRVLGLKPSGGREPLILDVVRPLCVFVAGLPDYARHTQRLSAEAIRVRSAILAAKDPVAFLFRELPRACGLHEFSVEGIISPDEARGFSRLLKGYLDELRGGFDLLLERLRNAIREEFDASGSFEQVRERLASRAEQILLLAGEPRLKALCMRLADAKLAEGAWLESLGSLLILQPPMRWKDADEDTFLRELRALAARFKTLESIGFKNARAEDFAEAFRLSLTKNDGSEVEQVVFVEKESLSDVRALASEIEKLLVHNRPTNMAALSRVVWSALSKD
jgi:hypothetical protein